VDRRITELLPSGVREQVNRLAEHVTNLRGVGARAAETESSLSTLIEELSLPVKLNVPAATVPKLIRLARTIAETGAMRPGWFEPANWTRIRQLCHDAIEKLDAADAAASRVSVRIPKARLSVLSQVAEELDLDAIDDTWRRLQHFCTLANRDDLASLARSANEASDILRHVGEATCSLAKQLGVGDGYGLSLRAAAALAELVGPLAETGIFHGSWTAAHTRARLREACNASVNDLSEAASLREALQERLSHRAFQPAVADLADRSSAYMSVLRRLFGGFGAFRREVTDLYKSNPPDTPTLLRDLARLGTFHRRIGAARGSATELADILPEVFVADDPTAWNRVLDAITAFESLIGAVPELPVSLAPRAVQLESASVAADQARLSAELARFRIAAGSAPIATICSETSTIREIGHEISSLVGVVTACLDTWERTAPHFAIAPAEFGGHPRRLPLHEGRPRPFRHLRPRTGPGAPRFARDGSSRVGRNASGSRDSRTDQRVGPPAGSTPRRVMRRGPDRRWCACRCRRRDRCCLSEVGYRIAKSWKVLRPFPP
jgi:hypothetical protein